MNHDAATMRSIPKLRLPGAFLAQFGDVVVVARLAPARCEDSAGGWEQLGAVEGVHFLGEQATGIQNLTDFSTDLVTATYRGLGTRGIRVVDAGHILPGCLLI